MPLILEQQLNTGQIIISYSNSVSPTGAGMRAKRWAFVDRLCQLHLATAKYDNSLMRALLPQRCQQTDRFSRHHIALSRFPNPTAIPRYPCLYLAVFKPKQVFSRSCSNQHIHQHNPAYSPAPTLVVLCSTTPPSRIAQWQVRVTPSLVSPQSNLYLERPSNGQSQSINPRPVMIRSSIAPST